MAKTHFSAKLRLGPQNALFELWGSIEVQNASSWSQLFKNIIFVAVRTFWHFFLSICRTCKKRPKMTIFSDFRGHSVEISEVLPVEISGVRSGLSSIFTGKKKLCHLDPRITFWKDFCDPFVGLQYFGWKKEKSKKMAKTHFFFAKLRLGLQNALFELGGSIEVQNASSWSQLFKKYYFYCRQNFLALFSKYL